MPERIVALAALAMLGLGCAGNPGPQLGSEPTEAAQQIADTKAAADSIEEPAAPEAPEAPSSVEESPAAAPPKRPSTLVLREGEQFEAARVEAPKEEAPSLWEASQAERRRRETAGRSTIVITDENLEEYAKGGQVTELVTAPLPEDDEAPESDAAAPEVDLETYWRERVRDARLAWRAAADRITELEGQVAKLRYDFYAQDDPYYRDSEIKPAWDRAALELERARAQVEQRRAEVDLALEAGVREGALPGWLREGLEFEPERPDDDSRYRREELPIVEAIDAPIAEDPPR